MSHTRSQLLWDLLSADYTRLGFDAVGDEAFRALVLARIVEPTSKADSLRVLHEVGVAGPSLRTVFRSLARSVERDYRGLLAQACMASSTRALGGLASLVLYDCTTLHFETGTADKLRRVRMSKERRVDPQIQVGLLVDPTGFPLEIHCFEGNTAETTTLMPVLHAFQARQGVAGMVVVADAVMLPSGCPSNRTRRSVISRICGHAQVSRPSSSSTGGGRRGGWWCRAWSRPDRTSTPQQDGAVSCTT